MEPDLHSLQHSDPAPWEIPGAFIEDSTAAEHPMIAAMQAFETEFLDLLLRHLGAGSRRKIELVEVGCGIGRLHYRYGMKTAAPGLASLADSVRLGRVRQQDPSLEFDAGLASSLARISGIDLSSRQLEETEGRLAEAGLSNMLRSRLRLRRGSIQSLSGGEGDLLPVVVSLSNAVGLLPPPNGAAGLFRSMRRMVEAAGGIALICAFRRRAVATHALPMYESLIHLFGQPRWLGPGDFIGMRYSQKPQRHKMARDPDPTVIVDVFDREGAMVKEQHILTRIPEEVASAVETGHIRTVGEYETRWFGEEQIAALMKECWSGLKHFHLTGRRLDPERAEAVQLAVLDASGLFAGMLDHWE